MGISDSWDWRHSAGLAAVVVAGAALVASSKYDMLDWKEQGKEHKVKSNEKTSAVPKKVVEKKIEASSAQNRAADGHTTSSSCSEPDDIEAYPNDNHELRDAIELNEGLEALGMLPGSVPCDSEERKHALENFANGPEMRPHPVEENEHVEDVVRLERVSAEEEQRRYFAAFNPGSHACADPFAGDFSASPPPTPSIALSSPRASTTHGVSPTPSGTPPRNRVGIAFENEKRRK